MVSGIPRLAAPREIAAVAWCTAAGLAGYIPAGIAPFVQDYLSQELRQGTAGT